MWARFFPSSPRWDILQRSLLDLLEKRWSFFRYVKPVTYAFLTRLTVAKLIWFIKTRTIVKDIDFRLSYVLWLAELAEFQPYLCELSTKYYFRFLEIRINHFNPVFVSYRNQLFVLQSNTKAGFYMKCNAGLKWVKSKYLHSQMPVCPHQIYRVFRISKRITHFVRTQNFPKKN